jgi:hypothetical protein
MTRRHLQKARNIAANLNRAPATRRDEARALVAAALGRHRQ